MEIHGRGINFLRSNALYLTEPARDAVKASLSQLEKCVQLNDHPQQLTKELETLVVQGERIRQALDLPDIRLSKFQSM